MRAPRYQFPEAVRSTTRVIASRMVHDGSVAESPEELDAWISRAPEIHDSLRKGGYGGAFTADDLFPLLQVFVSNAGGAPAPAPGSAPPPKSRALGRGLVVGVAVLVALLVIALAVGAFR